MIHKHSPWFVIDGCTLFTAMKILVMLMALIMLPLCLWVLLWMLPAASAADNWQVEGAHGVLQVRGELTESACRLEMASAYQAVWLGSTATAQLAKAGIVACR